MHLIPLDSASLQEAIGTQSQGHLLVVMFSASWCGPCARAKPLLDVMASCLSDVSFGVLIVDESASNQACAMSFDVNAFPTIVLFLDGQEVYRNQGFAQLELINRIQQLRPQFHESVASLMDNEPGLARSTANILLRIADNILAHPLDAKYRRLKVSSNTVSEKLLPVSGGIECLFAMGFVDDAEDCANGEYFVLAPGPLVRVARIRNQLVRLVTDTRHLPRLYVNMMPFAEAPPTRSLPGGSINQQLLLSLTAHLSGMPKYEDPGLQARARECVPVERLTEAARRAVAEQTGLKVEQVPLAERDALLCQLTAWFKNEFFKWTNSPNCSACGRECQSSAPASVSGAGGNLPPNEEERRYGAIRVESHYCGACQRVERFPRYNHPEKLLETRRGRCGEWANCFYLLCRAMRFEARFVYDVTDHVWVEVYSQLEERWLHVDPCENLIDAPLVYEVGWKKALSFVFAMSHEELVDVAWRYSARHKDLLARRSGVNEARLGELVACLEKTLQDDYLHLGAERKRLLLERRAREVVELLTPRSSSGDNAAESQGRQSGSLVWRLSRGEAGTPGVSADKPEASAKFKFAPTPEEVAARQISVTYDPVSDAYRRGGDSRVVIPGWRSCVNETLRLGLKRESDWRMVYLSRQEGCSAEADGSASWLVDLTGCGFAIGRVALTAEAAVFDSAVGVSWIVSFGGRREADEKAAGGDEEGELACESKEAGTFRFEAGQAACAGARWVRVRVRLTGGRPGDGLAWQKGQLFRRSMDKPDDPPPFSLLVELLPDCAVDSTGSQPQRVVQPSSASDKDSTEAAPPPAPSSPEVGTAAASALLGSGLELCGNVIVPTERELASGQLTLAYDIFSDRYARSSDGHSASVGWRSLTFEVENLRRVVEDNPGCPGRKVGYLCRERGGLAVGSVEWRVDLSALGGAYRLSNLRLMLSLASNHGGVATEATISADTGASVTVQESFYSGDVADGARWLRVRARIRGLADNQARGPAAPEDPVWGQLFRVADSNCPLMPLSLALDIVKA